MSKQQVKTKVLDDRWDEVIALEKRWDAFWARLGGFPTKRRYRLIFGGLPGWTWVWECEWESFEALVAAHERQDADPECKTLEAPWKGLAENMANELYWVLP